MVELTRDIVLAVRRFGDIPLERVGLRFWRADGIGVAGPADGRVNVGGRNRWVDGAWRAGLIGKQPVVAGVAWPVQRAGDAARVVHLREAMDGLSMTVVPAVRAIVTMVTAIVMSPRSWTLRGLERRWRRSQPVRRRGTGSQDWHHKRHGNDSDVGRLHYYSRVTFNDAG